LSLNNLPPQKQIPLKLSICLSAALLLIILAAGLRPEGFHLANKVLWIKDRPGIRFSRFGIAYTNPLDGLISSPQSDANGFSIEIALRPATYGAGGFEFILVLHDGKDNEQLVMGQWRSHLIIMNGDDYAYRKRIERISVDASSPSPTTRFVSITSGQEGTKIYFDGKLMGTKKDLTLKIPSGEKTRLVLGNSLYGKHPWRGDIYGLAIYNYFLSSQKAALHFKRWSKDHSFSFAQDDKPFVLYLFDEMEGTRALDHSGRNLHLEIPSRMQLLEKEILVPPWNNYNFNRSFISDIILNLIGFIPFGFILFATLIRFGGAFEKHGVLITVAFCFSVSFAIEILQAWIPSRSSSMLDLLLNSLGGWTGAYAYRFFGKVQGLIR
jgi:VanZ family protein